MTAEELQETLLNLIETATEAREEVQEEGDESTLADFARDIADDIEDIDKVVTYQREMMLTRDAGLVIRTASGDEFQLTIVQSRRGRADDGE